MADGRNNSFLKKYIVTKEQTEETTLSEIKQLHDPYEICDYLERRQKDFTSKCMRQLEDAIIATNDILQIYEFLFLATNKGITINIERFENCILLSENAKLMYYCLLFVSGVDKNKILSALLSTKNAMYIEALDTEEAREVMGDIRDLVRNYDMILNVAKQSDFFPKSLKQFEGLKKDINKLKRKVIESGNPYYITELANYIELINKYTEEYYSIEDLTRALLEIDDPMNLYEYLSSVASVKNKIPLIQMVANSKKSKQSIKKFLKYISEYVSDLNDNELDEINIQLKEIESR